MDAVCNAGVSPSENSIAEKDVYEEQHEPDTQEVKDEEEVNGQSQSTKKRRRRRRRKKGSTDESARDEELDKCLEEKKTEMDKPEKEKPSSAASRIYLKSKKDNAEDVINSAVTPVKDDEHDGDEDRKTPGSGKTQAKT